MIALELTKEDGSVVQEHVPIDRIDVLLSHRQLVGVSDNIAQLTCITRLLLANNAFTEMPSGVWAMTQLTRLSMRCNRLAAIPREIGRLEALTHLHLDHNKLVALPHEIGNIQTLRWLLLDRNALTSLPATLGQLRALKLLGVRNNRLEWLPLTIDLLPATTRIFLDGNKLALGDVDRSFNGSRSELPDIIAATTAVAMIREPAFDLLVGLQDLELPALVTLELVDAAFPNSIPMHKKWDLITAVKHF